MDKLALKLREDADKIDVGISDELDHRIEASLRATAPAKPAREVPRARPPWFWLASALTGATAAIAVIAIVNLAEKGSLNLNLIVNHEGGHSSNVPDDHAIGEGLAIGTPGRYEPGKDSSHDY